MAGNYYIDSTDTKTNKTLCKSKVEDTVLSAWFQNLFRLMLHLTSSTAKIFYQSKSTGAHLGLVTKLIESDIFVTGFWDPPSCQSHPILFAFPLILLLVWDEHWAPLTSKTCLKHSLAFRIKARTSRQSRTATRWHGKAAMTESRWQKVNMTITMLIQCKRVAKHRFHTQKKMSCLCSDQTLSRLLEIEKNTSGALNSIWNLVQMDYYVQCNNK